MFYCGIDIAKRNHEASVIDAEGKPLLDSITITNTQEGCEKRFSLFERLGIGKDAVIVGMEATGHYWLSVYEHLTEQKYDVRVINPIQSDAFRKMYIRQTKNDSKDSFIIAQVMRFGQYSATTLSDENTVAMRQLTRFRMALALRNPRFPALPIFCSNRDACDGVTAVMHTPCEDGWRGNVLFRFHPGILPAAVFFLRSASIWIFYQENRGHPVCSITGIQPLKADFSRI